MDNYKNKPNSPSLPTNANFMELSYVSENGQLMNKTDMNSSMSPADSPPRRASTLKKAQKAPVDNTIKVNFGAGAVQDLIYKFKDNSVRTTKYTLATWAPKSLILQFKRVANVYFLAISILTAMPFSPKQPASQIATFVMVLFFTMLKEGFEDFQRYKQDKEANSALASVYNYEARQFEKRKFQDIKAGDLLKVSQNEVIPADMLIVSTSAESGVAFVNTMNLDGETNLKEKLCPKQTMEWAENEVFNKKGSIKCEAPNEYLDSWEGSLMVDNQQYSCGFKQLALRGTSLKNTKYVLGYTVYTGHNTKIMKNAKNPPSKTSGVLRKMNQILYTVFILQALIIISFAGASVGWQGSNSIGHEYISLETEVTFATFIERYFTFLVAYSHLIPISLYVVLEILKLFQGTLMKWDVEMYYEPLDKYVNVKTSDLVEELGQVEMIFSDKTGTLTMNEMEFKKCSVNAKVYGEIENPMMDKFNINGDTRAFDIFMNPNQTPDKKAISDFFILLAVCHTVMPEYDPVKKKLNYQASSPDELALVEGAVRMGFKFIERTSSTVKITLPTGETQVWEVFLEFPFDSTRKRMSLIVRKNGSEDYYLMTKGADSIMFPRLIIDDGTAATVQSHLDRFAIDGLRTLVVAQKKLGASFVKDFIDRVERVKVSGDSDKEEKLAKLYDEQEQGLALVGCTAIEDKLQDGVPETIATLMEAGIRVWVLTGDKQETAIEIAKSCKLIQPDMETIILSSDTAEEFFTKLDKQVQFYNVNLDGLIPSLAKLTGKMPKKITVVINGSTLTWALETSQEVKNKFFRFSLLANSVVCCRVSPKQKADVVHMAKSFGPWTTLSIGDGANDVPMIMEAHVGVGIYGKEGTQAARTADFALGQFRYLKKLLLVHGRLAYRRISTFILYYFYKNVIVVFTEIYFAFYNGFSGQIYFPEWLPMLYNSLWTSWPPLFSFVLDKDVDKEYSYKYPKLYQAGPKGYFFNIVVFWRWMFFAAFHGVICFFLPVSGLSGVNDDSGQVRNHWWVSTMSFTLVMHVITLKLFIETTFWNAYNSGIAIFSLLLYYFSVLIMSANGVAKIVQKELNGIMFSIFGSFRAWLVLLFIPIVAIGPDVIFLVFKRVIRPNPSDKVLALYKSTQTKKPFRITSRVVEVR